jgi:tRNA(Ile)-lysidine synthetase-like protein
MERKNNNSEALFLKICRKVEKTILKEMLLEEEDHLLLGLSGGKDSMVLLETLANLKKSLPFEFKISAVHIKVKNVLYAMNVDFMQQLCDSLKIPLYIREIEPNFEQDKKKAPCFVCSWHRRKEIFNLGKELNCNKLAFGHHLDDAVETLLMNMMYHGSISSLPYSIEMFDGRVKLIRPLLDVREKEILEFSRLREYPSAEKSCIHDNRTKRSNTRRLIDLMDENYENSSINIFKALDNFYPEYLPKSRGVKKQKKKTTEKRDVPGIENSDPGI